jgi:hypothetical protein
MGDGYEPGSWIQTDDQYVIDDGTACRVRSPSPGTIGARGSSIETWDRERKLLEAAKGAAKYLPAESREEFLQLFTGMNLIITVGVFAAWGGSQFIPIVAEIVDAILLVAGAATIGWQVWQVARDILDFMKIARSAKTSADLDRASMHLANAVVVIGVTAFVALIMKYGSKLGSRAGSAAVAVADEYWGFSVEQWLIRMRIPKSPPLVQDRIRAALTYFKRELPQAELDTIQGYMEGIDFKARTSVEQVPLNAGQELIMYGDATLLRLTDPRLILDYLGQWFSEVGTAPENLGISRGGPKRQFVRLRVKPGAQIPALRSEAASVLDTWTWGRTANRMSFRKNSGGISATGAEYRGGGGIQYFIPRKYHGLLEVVSPPK